MRTSSGFGPIKSLWHTKKRGSSLLSWADIFDFKQRSAQNFDEKGNKSQYGNVMTEQHVNPPEQRWFFAKMIQRFVWKGKFMNASKQFVMKFTLQLDGSRKCRKRKCWEEWLISNKEQSNLSTVRRTARTVHTQYTVDGSWAVTPWAYGRTGYSRFKGREYTASISIVGEAIWCNLPKTADLTKLDDRWAHCHLAGKNGPKRWTHHRIRVWGRTCTISSTESRGQALERKSAEDGQTETFFNKFYHKVVCRIVHTFSSGCVLVTLRHGEVVRTVLVPQQNSDQAGHTPLVAICAKHTAIWLWVSPISIWKSSLL